VVARHRLGMVQWQVDDPALARRDLGAWRLGQGPWRLALAWWPLAVKVFPYQIFVCQQHAGIGLHSHSTDAALSKPGHSLAANFHSRPIFLNFIIASS